MGARVKRPQIFALVGRSMRQLIWSRAACGAAEWSKSILTTSEKCGVVAAAV